jgi:peptide/nickel transport system substrate-binding protein
LGRNPLGALGGAPKKTGNMEKMIFKFPASGTTFSDTAVGQAIKNGEVDLYSGSATASFWSTVSTDPGTVAARTSVALYEHFDIRTGDASSVNTTNSNGSCSAPYAGPFKGESQRAKDLRKAMLLVVPRQVIANTYIGKIFDPGFTGNSPVLNSSLSLTTEGDYPKIVAGISSFVTEFSKDQTARNAAALALMRKYYPNAGPGSNSISVKMLTSTAARRVDIALQIQLQADKVGIKLENTATTAWSGLINCNSYDVVTFAWSRSAISQTGSNANYESTGSNNRAGWVDEGVDLLTKKLETNLSATELLATKIALEKRIWGNYWTLPQYQWPGVSAWNKDLKNVLPSPLNPNVTWNYWALGY